MNSAYSVSSISPISDGKPNMRRITSALMPSIIAATSAIASARSVRTSQPLSRKTRAMRGGPASERLRQQCLELADGIGAELAQVVPIEVDGGLLEFRAEVDRLDSLLGLQVERGLGGLAGVALVVGLEPGDRIVDHLA